MAEFLHNDMSSALPNLNTDTSELIPCNKPQTCNQSGGNILKI